MLHSSSCDNIHLSVLSSFLLNSNFFLSLKSTKLSNCSTRVLQLVRNWYLQYFPQWKYILKLTPQGFRITVSLTNKRKRASVDFAQGSWTFGKKHLLISSIFVWARKYFKFKQKFYRGLGKCSVQVLESTQTRGKQEADSRDTGFGHPNSLCKNEEIF